MSTEILILMLEAIIMYFLVLGAHSLRHRFGPVHFYALIGGITAIMSWVTDAGLSVSVGNITFVVGSTVFYTSLLLGVFVVYVFDGPRATRITISTVVGVSIMMPLIAAVLHFQTTLINGTPLTSVPLPSLRINTASVITTLIDLFFLAIAWEFLGKPSFQMKLWFRAFLTLLGVMWLDVILFATGAFAGTPGYLNIMQGTLVSRFFISIFALPFLYGYLYWQSHLPGVKLENRPILAILKQVAEMEKELTLAQQEIERRKRAEKALQESEERYRMVSELVSDYAYAFRVTPDGSLVRSWVTEAFSTITGYQPEELPTNENWRAIVHPEDRERVDRYIATFLKEESNEIEYRIVTKAGEVRWILGHDRPVWNEEEQRVTHVYGAVEDITERRALKDRIQHQERLAAVGQLAGGIAHDFNNLLAAILLHTELALQKPDLRPSIERALHTVKQQSKHAAKLVEQILDFSRRTMLEKEPLDLVDFLGETTDMLRRTIPENIHLKLDLDPNTCTIVADSTRIQQLLVNLITNARDAMLDGGELQIGLHTCNVDAEKQPPVADMQPGAWACLSVEDTGEGMSEDVQAHLFEPFFTTKDPGVGTGLGLAQVHGIVKQHAGYIDVTSAPGSGTTFEIFFPCHDVTSSAAEEETESDLALGTEKTVLLVEDDDVLREVIAELLQTLGYTVLTAANGQKALPIMRDNTVDLLITDIVMPEMGGERLLQVLQTAENPPPAIAITGYALKEDRDALRAAGFAEIIKKPFNAQSLAQAVSRTLTNCRSSPPIPSAPEPEG